jgi:hypothetical protein
MIRAKQTDADFFTMIHDLRRDSGRSGNGSQRRVSERHAFHCRQWIALYDGEQQPDERTFREVDCCDFSTGGFSFLVPQLPRADRLCVRLGGPGAYVFMNALIVHCMPVDTDGAPGFMIGCRFTTRSEAKPNPVVEAAVA